MLTAMGPVRQDMCSERGLTLVELLIVISIIAALAALMMPVIGLIRERARNHEAKQKIAQMTLALTTYATLDARHRYPLHTATALSLYVVGATPGSTITPMPHPLGLTPQGNAPAISGKDGSLLGVLGALVDIDGAMLGSTDAQGLLNDPWGRPFNYQLTRPAPTLPAGALQDWNWDSGLGRPKAWNAVAAPPCPAPFPYLWSLGKAGSATDATTWIYDK